MLPEQARGDGAMTTQNLSRRGLTDLVGARQRFDIVGIGGSQAGLAIGYWLSKLGTDT
jgi:hypothetical protein